MKTYEEYTGNGSSHRRPEQIERDVAAIRREMSETIEAIENKLSPGEMLDFVVHRFRGIGGGTSQFVGNLSGALRDNPIPATLIGVGLGYLLWYDKRRASGPSYEGRTERAKALAKDKLAQGTEAVKEAGANVAEGVRSGVDRARGTAEKWLEEPLVVAALGVACGAVVGALLPRTQTEDELLGEKREQLAQKARSAGMEALDRAQQKAEEAAERVAKSIDERID
jgi:hypothetical protein